MARLLLAVFLLLGLRAAKTSAQKCGEELDGYDYKALTKQSSWFFEVDPSECPGEGIVECQVEFAICHDLDLDACSKPSAVCMSYVADGSNPSFGSYSLGNESTSAPLSSGEPEGFSFSFSNGDPNPTCNTSAEIMILFQCNKSASWDYRNPVHNNVTQYVAGFTSTKACVYSAVLNYSGACLQEFPVEPYNCELPGYDLAPLANAPAWIATPPPGMCYFPDGFTPLGGSPCTLYFSFCKVLSAGSCYNSVFCEMVTPGTTLASLSFGTYYPNITAEETKESNGFVLEYEHGSQTDTCPEGLISTLSFVCNKSAIWPDLIDYNVTEYMTAADDEQFCQYDITFQYSGACSNSSSSSSATSIVGWILMAVVIGIALIYLVTGVAVQYVRGRRGIELIPNIDFWKLFFLLFLEGCQFTLNIVTCYQLRPAMPKSVSNRDYEAL